FVAWESDGPRVVIDSRITEVVGIRPDELREHAEVLLAHELGEIALGHGAPPDSDDEAREREFACDAFAARLLSCERVIQTLSITRLVGRSTGRGGHPTNEERIEQLAELWKGPRK